MNCSQSRIRVSLPPIDAHEALLFVNVLERLISALWRTHGDRMADILARRGIDTPMPEDATYSGNPNLDLDDFPF